MPDEKQTEVLLVAKAFQTFVNTVVVIKNNSLLKPATLEKLDGIANTVLDKLAIAVTHLELDEASATNQASPETTTQ